MGPLLVSIPTWCPVQGRNHWALRGCGLNRWTSGSQVQSSLGDLGVSGFSGSQGPSPPFLSFPKARRTILLMGWIPGPCTHFSQGYLPWSPLGKIQVGILQLAIQVLLTSPASTPSLPTQPSSNKAPIIHTQAHPLMVKRGWPG